jgi:hypothetical protein
VMRIIEIPFLAPNIASIGESNAGAPLWAAGGMALIRIFSGLFWLDEESRHNRDQKQPQRLDSGPKGWLASLDCCSRASGRAAGACHWPRVGRVRRAAFAIDP